ncbi:hypothetical protein Pr1d_48950 [Bythopirellula goksoeyrii]|uniref:Uncharacterized protein n=1 Tax=Bythopirellula goksoeyrii TaxID=1400387 RepID=A0A5B9QHW6_9BACT|nr:hypothetical protein Pr1d_48950 [Bythopirellula goksoeyrii]
MRAWHPRAAFPSRCRSGGTCPGLSQRAPTELGSGVIGVPGAALAVGTLQAGTAALR